MVATDNHPFWVAGLDEWVDAANLRAGQWLRTSAGTHVQISATRQWTEPAQVHNLTVDDIHTYYVLAGNTPVLVHNCNNVISNADGYDNAGALGAHGNGTAFSGIYEPSTGGFRAHLSVDPDMPNPPANSVRRLGGHGQINFEHFGGSRETVGFTMFSEEGGFSVSWMSRSVNGRNHGNPLAPVGTRQSIMDAISAATGRKVWSR
ncbi:polymorphic toxin-type HINT domain-containing protein [Micromonospora marina]|uniref:Intein C-terminal splicing region n=1 Tax=Micromonospora marina TaxID=307120 RepID=A0A1C4XWR5_9ACTN|nr:polymorphic toxin-type HINT domain-containing protein [Micromonospora marina]SCF12880.1 intein C-terminal splicing region [Micromonospora marina]